MNGKSGTPYNPILYVGCQTKDRCRGIEMSDETRYWERIGTYVSRQFAEEYIDRSKETGITGEYLETELEEYQQITTVSPETLRREIEDIFSKPFEVVTLPAKTQALLGAVEMENNKVKIVKGFMADGLTKDEAKDKFTQVMNEMVGEALGLEKGNSNDSEDAPHEEE